MNVQIKILQEPSHGSWYVDCEIAGIPPLSGVCESKPACRETAVGPRGAAWSECSWKWRPDGNHGSPPPKRLDQHGDLESGTQRVVERGAVGADAQGGQTTLQPLRDNAVAAGLRPEETRCRPWLLFDGGLDARPAGPVGSPNERTASHLASPEKKYPYPRHGSTGASYRPARGTNGIDKPVIRTRHGSLTGVFGTFSSPARGHLLRFTIYRRLS